MITALILLAAFSSQVDEQNKQVLPTDLTALNQATVFCEQLITQPVTATPERFDVYMDFDKREGIVRPFTDVPSKVRAIADTFATGNQLKTMFRTKTVSGEVWVATLVKSPRCLIATWGTRPGLNLYLDFVGFGFRDTEWKRKSGQSNSGGNVWTKVIPSKDSPTYLFLEGKAWSAQSDISDTPLKHEDIGLFLFMARTSAIK